MATKNPRIMVMLKPSTHAVILRMSQLTKNSQSAIIGTLLEESEPIFARMVRVLEAAQEAQTGVRMRVRESLQAAEDVLDKQLGLMLGDLESRTSDLVDDLERVERRRRAAPAPAAAQPHRPGPPLSNRGGATPAPTGNGVGRRVRRQLKGRRK